MEGHHLEMDRSQKAHEHTNYKSMIANYLRIHQVSIGSGGQSSNSLPASECISIKHTTSKSVSSEPLENWPS